MRHIQRTAPSGRGVKVKQVMIMKGKDDSENRTEREEREREAIFACFGNRAAPRATDVQRANEGRRWSATGKGAQIFVMVVVDMIMTNFSNI